MLLSSRFEAVDRLVQAADRAFIPQPAGLHAGWREEAATPHLPTAVGQALFADIVAIGPLMHSPLESRQLC